MPSPAARGGSPARTLLPGDLVGLCEDRGPQLAVVQAIRGSRAELRAGPEGRALSLPLRLLDPIAGAGDSPPARTILVAPWGLDPVRLAAALPRLRDFGTAWLLLREEQGPEAAPLSLEAFTALVGDAGDPAQRAACWLWLHGSQTLFRWRQGGALPLPAPEQRRLRGERRRRRLQQHRQQRWSELLRLRRPLASEEALGPEARQDLELLRRWAAGDALEPLPDPLQRTLQQARCPAEPGAIRHLLADLGQWPRHHLPAMEGSLWQRGFSADLLAEADRLLASAGEERPGDAERLDLCALHTVTIDDDDTADIDDGLSIEWAADGTPLLWIHVADPGRLIEPGSPLDLEARRRASSLYLAQDILPMFPAPLATGPFSLRAGHRCPAWSVRLRLDETGAITESLVRRTWIRPAYRLSYADADEILELAPPQERDLLALQAALLRRRRWRLERGALVLDQPEGRVRSRGESSELEIIEPGPSRTLVAEAMILAGAAVATLGQQRNLPLPYRGQPAGNLPAPAELAALPPGPVRHAAIKRGLSRGHVGTTPSPHFSLGLDAYVQATSPIRRYSDLLVQRQLQAELAAGPRLEEGELASLLAEIEPALRQGIAISRDDQRHWQQVWFEQHPRLEWRALFLRWLRPQDQLGLIHFEELALELPAHCPARSEPGDALLVRVALVDSLRDQLRLEARP